MYPVNYSVIVPVYRGELSLPKLTSELIFFFTSQNQSYELILVDDFAPDKSWEIIKSLKQNYGEVISGIRLIRNFGQHNALLCGIQNASGEFVITLDEDLQHSPKDLIRLIKKQKESDYDLVYGKYSKLNHSKFRNLTSCILKKLLSLAIPGLFSDYTAFRLVKSDIAKKILNKPKSYIFVDAMLSSVANKITSTTVSHYKCYSGKSSYNLHKLGMHATNILINYSILIVRIMVWSILVILLGSLISGIFLFILTIYLKIHFEEKPSIIEIGKAFLILFLLVTGAKYVTSFIISILSKNKSGYIISESI